MALSSRSKGPDALLFPPHTPAARVVAPPAGAPGSCVSALNLLQQVIYLPDNNINCGALRAAHNLSLMISLILAARH